MRTAAFVLLVSFGFAQSQDNPRSPRDRADIVQRVAASDLTLVGTVMKMDLAHDLALDAQYAAITPDTSRETLLEIQRTAEHSQAVLFTVRVDEVFCGGDEFRSTPGAAKGAPPKQVYVFVPLRGGAAFHDVNQSETLFPEGKFLLILKSDSDSPSFMKRFGLPSGSYYRAVEGVRGTVQLERSSFKIPAYSDIGILNSADPNYTADRSASKPVSAPPGTYDKETREAAALAGDARAICEAVAPANVLQKNDGLERLKSSPDSTMRQNAEIALKILRGEPIQ
jgi:hypothetical protein